MAVKIANQLASALANLNCNTVTWSGALSLHKLWSLVTFSLVGVHWQQQQPLRNAALTDNPLCTCLETIQVEEANSCTRIEYTDPVARAEER